MLGEGEQAEGRRSTCDALSLAAPLGKPRQRRRIWLRRKSGAFFFLFDVIVLLGAVLCLQALFYNTQMKFYLKWADGLFLPGFYGLFEVFILFPFLPLFFARVGHYAIRVPNALVVRHIFLGVTVLMAVHAYASTLMRGATFGSWDIAVWPLVFAALTTSRIGARSILNRLGWWVSPVAVVAPRVMIEPTREVLINGLIPGLTPVRAIAIEGAGPRQIVADIQRLHAAGTVDHVVFAAVTEDAAQLSAIVLRLEAVSNIPYSIIPQVGPLPMLRYRLGPIVTNDVVVLNRFGGYHRTVAPLSKRLFDVTVSILMLGALAPLFLLIIAAVSLDGAKPFYGSPRVGHGGRVFRAWKFRTMVPNAEQVLRDALARCPDTRRQWNSGFKLANDPRVTRVGRFLRTTSLDELPQLWNVVTGAMSLVGPRPILLSECDAYGDDLALYTRIRPGITGLWQINGRNDLEYQRRVELNSWYVKNWSLWGDLVILAQTVPAVLRKRGAG